MVIQAYAVLGVCAHVVYRSSLSSRTRCSRN
jgi:hypothetical protein